MSLPPILISSVQRKNQPFWPSTMGSPNPLSYTLKMLKRPLAASNNHTKAWPSRQSTERDHPRIKKTSRISSKNSKAALHRLPNALLSSGKDSQSESRLKSQNQPPSLNRSMLAINPFNSPRNLSTLSLTRKKTKI